MKKLVLTLTSILFTASMLFAQTNGGSALPGSQGDYANTDPAGDNQTTTYIMEETTVPAYAVPDPYYHPNNDPWNATPNYSLTAGFTWTWDEATGTLTFGTNDANDNYTTITAPAGSAAGSPYTVTVTENAPAAYGGCSGAATTLTVNVVARPAITIGGDATYSYCAGDVNLPTDIQSTITGGWSNYRAIWNLEIATLNDASAKEFYYDDELGTNPSGTQKYAVEYTDAVPQSIADAASAPDLMTVSDFEVINNGTRNAVTVYTYVLTGINDKASRFGQFISLDGDATDPTAFTYNNSVETVVVTVYPAPETGPIFHIDDSWAD